MNANNENSPIFENDITQGSSPLTKPDLFQKRRLEHYLCAQLQIKFDPINTTHSRALLRRDVGGADSANEAA